MATEEKYSLSPELTGWLGEYLNSLGVESIEELRQKLGKAEGGKTEIVKIETNIYDKEEIYSDPEYMEEKLNQRLTQIGFLIENGRIYCAEDDNGNIVSTKTLGSDCNDKS